MKINSLSADWCFSSFACRNGKCQVKFFLLCSVTIVAPHWPLFQQELLSPALNFLTAPIILPTTSGSAIALLFLLSTSSHPGGSRRSWAMPQQPLPMGRTAVSASPPGAPTGGGSNNEDEENLVACISNFAASVSLIIKVPATFICPHGLCLHHLGDTD